MKASQRLQWEALKFNSLPGFWGVPELLIMGPVPLKIVAP